MNVFVGRTGNRGTAAGPIFLLEERPASQKRRCEPQRELQKLRRAMDAVRRELRQAVADADRETSAILEAQYMMLNDSALVSAIQKIILEEQVNADYAAEKAGQGYADLFEQMEDEYMRMRSVDILNVTDRIADAVTGYEAGVEPPVPSVVVAEDVTPEYLSRIGKEKILALVTRGGSLLSHTAIVCGILGIPYVYGVGFDREAVAASSFGGVDGESACFFTDPDRVTLERLVLGSSRPVPGIYDLASGYGLKVFANISTPEDVAAVLESRAEGVGLYRTEFLYTNRLSPPSEKEQYEAYRRVLEGLEGMPVVIRTADIGADKRVRCLRIPDTDREGKRLRGIRVSLEFPGMFRTQLRALFRAACLGDLRIMYPLITSPEEIRRIRLQAELAVRELELRGDVFRVPPQGIMVETTEAVERSAELAGMVDFFSIGSNDLTRALMAESGEEIPDERAQRGRLMDMIRRTAANAREQGIPGSVCGELAANPEAVPLRAEAGMEAISVSPPRI
jgi:phosphotransferase system enzyme I (PtsI)